MDNVVIPMTVIPAPSCLFKGWRLCHKPPNHNSPAGVILLFGLPGDLQTPPNTPGSSHALRCVTSLCPQSLALQPASSLWLRGS